jgi:PAS domain-containing protein
MTKANHRQLLMMRATVVFGLCLAAAALFDLLTRPSGAPWSRWQAALDAATLLAAGALVLHALRGQRRIKHEAEHRIPCESAFLYATLASVNDPIILKTLDGHPHYWNEAYVRRFGLPASGPSFEGSWRSRFLEPRVISQIFAAVRDGQPWTGAAKMKPERGSALLFDLHVEPVIDVDGEVIGLVAIHRKPASALAMTSGVTESSLPFEKSTSPGDVSTTPPPTSSVAR